MGTNVIEIEGLRKEYRRRKGRTVAIDGLDLVVPEGGVFGFLGPNGSGKTTTIRCILGLANVTKGSVRLLGRPVVHSQRGGAVPPVGAWYSVAHESRWSYFVIAMITFNLPGKSIRPAHTVSAVPAIKARKIVT